MAAASHEQRIAELEEDNNALRAMIQRNAAGTAAYRDASASEKLGIINEKLMEDLRSERERRTRAEAALAATKDQLDLLSHKKDAEVRKAGDLLKKARSEVDELRKRERELTQELEAERRENSKMKETLKTHRLNKDGTNASTGAPAAPPPDYAAKPSKPFSSLLRSVSPNGHGGPQRALHPSYAPKGLTPRVSKQQPVESPSQQRRGKYSAAEPLRQPGTSARQASKSPSGARRLGSTLPEYKVGSKVLWQGVAGVVRYVGIVHCLGNGTWFGVELAEPGKGEHGGTLSGVKYFTALNKTGVFCKITELSAPRPVSSATSRVATTNATSNPQSPTAADQSPAARRGSSAGATRRQSSVASTRGPAKPAAKTPAKQKQARAESESPAKSEPAPAEETVATEPAAEPAPSAQAEPAATESQPVPEPERQPEDKQPAQADAPSQQEQQQQQPEEVTPAEEAAPVQPAEADPTPAVETTTNGESHQAEPQQEQEAQQVQEEPAVSKLPEESAEAEAPAELAPADAAEAVAEPVEPAQPAEGEKPTPCEEEETPAAAENTEAPVAQPADEAPAQEAAAEPAEAEAPAAADGETA